MILVIGEILFDIFPNFKRLGGAPFNFAYHLKHLGMPVRFISRIGNDANGQEILERITAAGFDRGDIQQDDSRPTGTVQVQLDGNGVPTFDIVPNVAYDKIEYLPHVHSKYLGKADLIYFGTLAQRTGHGFKHIQRFLNNKNSLTISFYDINLRPHCYSSEVILSSLHHADIAKLNTDELEACRRICGIKEDGAAAVHHMMKGFSLDMIALTKGLQGSELYALAGVHRSASQPVEAVADTVGAGDAYAAMLAVGILKKWPPQKALSMATAFASRVCTINGAIPDETDFYAPVRAEIFSGG